MKIHLDLEIHGPHRYDSAGIGVVARPCPESAFDVVWSSVRLRQIVEAPEFPNSAQSGRRSTDAIIPSVYDQLRELAAKKMAGEPAGQTLSATALVHEAYLVLAKDGEPQWDNRGHFYVAAANAMRRILIGRARIKKTQRRGEGVQTIPLPEDSIHAPIAPMRAEELLALDEALEKLAQISKRQADLVTLRYFVGLSLDEASEALGISVATVKRDWTYARAWLNREMSSAE